MRRKLGQSITEFARREHERSLTQTIRVVSAADVPPGYQRIDAPSRPIFAKAQVLSSKCGRPIFVHSQPADASAATYWVHEEIMFDLARWLHLRIFAAHEVQPHA